MFLPQAQRLLDLVDLQEVYAEGSTAFVAYLAQLLKVKEKKATTLIGVLPPEDEPRRDVHFPEVPVGQGARGNFQVNVFPARFA